MITVLELEDKIEEAFKLKELISTLKKELAEYDRDLELKQLYIKDMLSELGMETYHSKCGIFSFTEVETFKVPKDTLNREIFFSYLKSLGIFDNMITVDSRTLNAFAKQDIEAHREAGDIDKVLDYSIPGIEKGQPYTKFVMRRAS